MYKSCLCALMNELMFHSTGVLKITLNKVDSPENYAVMRFPSFPTILFLYSCEILQSVTCVTAWLKCYKLGYAVVDVYFQVHHV